MTASVLSCMEIQEVIMKKIACYVLSVVMLLLYGCGIGGSYPSTQYSNSEELTVTMLDVGQGLSVLVEESGHAMLYDGGSRSASSYVVAYLKEHGNTELDYIIASHYDEDHIAGLVGVLNTAKVKEAIIPEYTTDTSIFNSFMKAIEKADEVTYAKAGDSYELGSATIDILSACQGNETSENDKSTVVRVSCGKFSLMLTGDAEKETERNLVQRGKNLHSTVYVVGHHGSSSSSSESFIQAMQPEIALISVGANNKYGHPTSKTLNALESNGIKVYRTDISGTIILNYNGDSYTITNEKGNNLGTTVVDEEKNESTNTAEQLGEYVLNTNTKKFHNPECSAAKKINNRDKEYSVESRERLLSEGYSSCKICNP